MKILVINCGSSSIKYKLYKFPSHDLIIKGSIEKIGEEGNKFKNHNQGIKKIISDILKKRAISDLSQISAIGHRVVHGGEAFRQPHLIDSEVLEKIQACSELAPLHNPANLAGIRGCLSVFPRTVPQAAVFDTAFHQSLSSQAYIYAIPLKYYEKHKIRKYGFHGTSHQFIAQIASKKLKKPLAKLKLITCHLGNGCSIAAIEGGKSVETSMGFTPLEGLIMGTRCGDIDTAAVFYIMRKEKLSINKMDKILNKESGLLGVSGVSNDWRLIKKEAESGNKKAKLSLDMFIHRIRKYIGAYYLILGGADAVCFTGGIGENNPDIINLFRKDISRIADAKTRVMVIPTDEEFMIACLTHELVKPARQKV